MLFQYIGLVATSGTRPQREILRGYFFRKVFFQSITSCLAEAICMPHIRQPNLNLISNSYRINSIDSAGGSQILDS
jgi:hypothetical protein